MADPFGQATREFIAFTVPGRGLFQFKPFGLHSGGATWQRLMDMVIGPEFEPWAFAYLEDIIIVTPTFEKHIEILNGILANLKKVGITLSREKFHFCKPEIKYLGYVVDKRELRVDLEKVETILQITPPTNVKGVRRLLGLLSWYHRFINNYSSLISPITTILRKDEKFN